MQRLTFRPIWGGENRWKKRTSARIWLYKHFSKGEKVLSHNTPPSRYSGINESTDIVDQPLAWFR